MATFATGSNKITTALHSWTEEDRNEAIEFGKHPANTVTTTSVYLKSRGITASFDTVDRWRKTLIEESDRIKRVRTIFHDYKGLAPHEIQAFIAGVMADTIISVKEKIDRSIGNAEDNVMHRDIQALTSLAKEARSSALAMAAVGSPTSMKELEMGFALSYSNKLESIFEGDEITIEKIKTACKAIAIEIESQHG